MKNIVSLEDLKKYKDWTGIFNKFRVGNIVQPKESKSKGEVIAIKESNIQLVKQRLYAIKFENNDISLFFTEELFEGTFYSI